MKFKKIIEYFCSKNKVSDVEEFILDYKEAWYSGGYYVLRYSINGGKTFKYIYHAERPAYPYEESSIQDNWEWNPLHFNANKTPFKSFKEKFNCLTDVENYEKEQKEIYNNGLKEVRDERLRRKKQYLANLEK